MKKILEKKLLISVALLLILIVSITILYFYNVTKPELEKIIYKGQEVRLAQVAENVYEYNVYDYSSDFSLDINDFSVESNSSFSFNKKEENKYELILTSILNNKETYIVNILNNPNLIKEQCPLGDGINDHYADQLTEEIIFDSKDIVYTDDTCRIDIDVDGDKDITLVGKLTVNGDQQIFFNDQLLVEDTVEFYASLSLDNMNILKDAFFFTAFVNSPVVETKLYGLTADKIILERSTLEDTDGYYFFDRYVTDSIDVVNDSIQFEVTTHVKDNVSIDKVLYNNKKTDICSVPNETVLFADYKVKYLGNGLFEKENITKTMTVYDIKYDLTLDGSLREPVESCK